MDRSQTAANSAFRWLFLLLVFGVFFPFTTGVHAQDGICAMEFLPVAVPLPDLGAQSYRRMDGQETNFTGGLYPGGSNTRPAAHEAAGLTAAAQIMPRDAQGEPNAAQGRIVMVSIGMSNTNSEFGAFMNLANQSEGINPRLVLINGALGGQTADKWIDPNALAWQMLDNTITQYGYSPLQVQVAWVKQTLTRGGTFPEKAQELQADLEVIAQLLKERFPNLQIAYFSSRTRSYTYERGLSPEPLAYETGFAVKWMIEKQIMGDAALNFDPARGPVRAPYLSWGPYLWADGENPRSDGFTWLSEDMTADCTHPSLVGQQKIAALLMDFFKTDTTTVSWFLANPPQTAAATTRSTPTATPTQQPSPTPTQAAPPANSPTQDLNQTAQLTESPTAANAPALETLAGAIPTHTGTPSQPGITENTPTPEPILLPTSLPGDPADSNLMDIRIVLIALTAAVLAAGVWWLLRRPR